MHNSPFVVNISEEAYTRAHCMVNILYISKLENMINNMQRMYASTLEKAFAQPKPAYWFCGLALSCFVVAAIGARLAFTADAPLEWRVLTALTAPSKLLVCP